jgi:DNA-binding PadR family transcriptional regulator
MLWEMEPHMPPAIDDSTLSQELRRGTLILAVLSALGQGEQCGADLRIVLGTAGLPIEEGALYPMLRRLETQGLLVSERRFEDSRVKRFYTLSAAGHAAQHTMLTQWHVLSESLKRLNGAQQ